MRNVLLRWIPPTERRINPPKPWRRGAPFEKEKPQKIVDYQHDSKQKKEWKELQVLYRYWKRERPGLEKRINQLRGRWAKKYKSKLVPTPDGKYFEHVVLKNDKKAWAVLHRAEDKFTKLENEMLRRLINARQHLWCS
jgi:hypothetical protein